MQYAMLGSLQVSRIGLGAMTMAGEVRKIAAEASATAARVARVEENTAADGVILTADQLQRLDNITPTTGARHDEFNEASIDR
jgi:aryl-alcohol dehydrogenase-like predicted oxidoreductase